jgi:hypothetical protein
MESKLTDIETRNDEYKKGRAVAMTFGGFVYVGVVLAATVLYISFVLLAFPPNAYVSRIIMSFAGALVGGSMIAFPLALHLWAVEKWHRGVTTGLYYLEILIVGVNTVVAFMSLLSKYAGYGATPEWVVLYEPFSIGAIIYTLVAWGTVFLLDPEHKRRAKDLENQEKFETKIAQRESEFLDSPQGEDVIQEFAELRVQQKFNLERYKSPRNWGTGRKKQESLPESDSAPQLPGPKKIEIPVDVYKQLLQDANIPYPVELEHENGKTPKDPTSRLR